MIFNKYSNITKGMNMLYHRNTIILLASSALFLSGSALANGLGEDRPYKFRDANDRQVLLNLERTRLEFFSGVGSAYGLGHQQKGNDTYIHISGDNNTVDVNQEHTGDQSTQSSSGSSSNVLNN